MPTFRVMTYNILFGGVGRESLIREVVSAVRPDIAVFTEVTSAASLDAIAEVVGAHRAGVSRFTGEHPVIVSRWPIVRSDSLWPPWSRQKWVEATIQPDDGPLVAVCGVHLTPHLLWPFELARRDEVRRLRARFRSPR
jgi:hypothetical protein